MNNEIIQWACYHLTSHGYTLKSNLPEDVQSTPWSHVVRFATTDGYVYLKQTPKLLAIETIIDQILYDQFHAPVPKIIAYNSELNCFLMNDSGRPLREILKKKFDTILYRKAINEFTAMQLAVADHIDIFTGIGVPDWRLDKIPDLYKDLVSQNDMLIADGLSETEVSELKNLTSMLINLCNQLSRYSIKQSIVQPDFHDNNILVKDVTLDITIIDLGEIVISHPFFSLVNCLRQAKRHHSITDTDEAFQQLFDACLKNYMPFESKENLLDAFELSRKIWFIYEALAHYRLIKTCDHAQLKSFQRQGRLSGSLREFLTACK